MIVLEIRTHTTNQLVAVVQAPDPQAAGELANLIAYNLGLADLAPGGLTIATAPEILPIHDAATALYWAAERRASTADAIDAIEERLRELVMGLEIRRAGREGGNR